jgi:hypothetical protein
VATENRWDDVPVETEGHECLFHSAGDVCREARSKQGRVGFIQVDVGKIKGCPWIMGNEEWKRWGLQTVKESVMGGGCRATVEPEQAGWGDRPPRFIRGAWCDCGK